jgi:anti-sigma B factor antagonist
VSTEPFRLEVDREHEGARVRPIGDLDLATVGQLERRLGDLIDAGVRSIVLDLRGLSFIDSTGLSLAMRWTRAAEQDGFAFSLIQGGRPIRRVFELSGMARRVHFVTPDE